jgi:hypothetical protein
MSAIAPWFVLESRLRSRARFVVVEICFEVEQNRVKSRANIFGDPEDDPLRARAIRTILSIANFSLLIFAADTFVEDEELVGHEGSTF